MFGLVVIVALVATVVIGTVLGRRYRVGPPVLLILLGALLGLVPRFGDVQIDGEIVLLLFLPAILYWESLNTSFRELRWNLRIVIMFSIGLVIATAVAVSWTARAPTPPRSSVRCSPPPTPPPWPVWPNDCRAGP